MKKESHLFKKEFERMASFLLSKEVLSTPTVFF